MTLGWHLRGWENLISNDSQPLAVVREQLDGWLSEVPEPYRSVWRKRLMSYEDHHFYSVRLELFMHHYFHSKKWGIHIEREMPNTLNKPDFVFDNEDRSIVVEAKVVFDREDISEQTQRLRRLADEMGKALDCDIMIQALSDLPPSLPNKAIRHEIRQMARDSPQYVQEFVISMEHLGISFELNIIIFPGRPPGNKGEVGGTIEQVRSLDSGTRLREAIAEKAGKYGRFDVPYVIAVWPEGLFHLWKKMEFSALYGTEVWNYGGTSFARTVTPGWLKDGLFLRSTEGQIHNTHVSAVVFYQFKYTQEAPDYHEHLLRVYHNPFADIPLSLDTFKGHPQLVPDEPSEVMKWIDLASP